ISRASSRKRGRYPNSLARARMESIWVAGAARRRRRSIAGRRVRSGRPARGGTPQYAEARMERQSSRGRASRRAPVAWCWRMARAPGSPLEALLALSPLESLPRTGWAMRGIANAETVAGHVLGTCHLILALGPRVAPPIDTERCLALALVHDA